MSRRAWLYFIAVGVLWGLPYFFIRVAVRDLEPGTLIFLRTALASLILLPFAVRRRRWRALLGHLPTVVVYTAGEMAIPWLLLATAEEKVASSFAGLLIAVVPLIGALFSTAVLGYERLGPRRLSGLFLGIAGVAVLVGVDVGGADATSILEIFGCAIGYAAAPIVVSRRLVDVPTFEVVTASVVITALAYLPFGVTHLPVHLTAEAAWSVVGLAVLCTTVAFMLFFALIKEAGPTRAVVVTYLNPAVAILLGVVALSEPLTLGMAIGFPVILVGSVLGTWSQTVRVADRGALPTVLSGPEPATTPGRSGEDLEAALMRRVLGKELD